MLNPLLAQRSTAVQVLALVLLIASPVDAEQGLDFPEKRFTSESFTIGGRTVHHRSWRNIVYVSKPRVTDAEDNNGLVFHQMNVFVPEAFFNGEAVNGFTAETAPILLISSSGGYLPGAPADLPGRSGDTMRMALSRGYVVAGPGQRGHNNKDPQTGENNGKAPAGIVDLKAAVRYLRRNDKAMAGDAEKIVSTGGSSGGAFSCLLGATGNSKDYEPYLREIGAAEGRDDVFAASCYCPITNLENADAAYEWQFRLSSTFERWRGEPRSWSEHARRVSKDLGDLFPAYLNSLRLAASRQFGDIRVGTPLTLDDAGDGSFKDYVASFVIEAAQQALDDGQDLSGAGYLDIQGNTVVGIDFDAYSDVRMKTPPAFDALGFGTPETSLFGGAAVDVRHFTSYASKSGEAAADQLVIKMMNPMRYVGKPGTSTAKHWRIRHGTEDRHTSLAIPVILATALEGQGAEVDFALPWNTRHGGHYDLDELFARMDGVTRR